MSKGFISMKVAGLGKIDAKIKRWSKEAPEVSSQILYTSVEDQLIPAIQQNIKDMGLIFEGNLFRAVSARVILSVGKTAVVDVGAWGIDYAMALENGQKPGTKQDLNKLIRCARLKMGIPAKNAVNVAKKIQSSIDEKGTKAYRFVGKAWAARKPIVYADFVYRMEMYFT